jgi:hypothetical protein
MKIGVPASGSGNREGEPNKTGIVKGSDYLPANFAGDHKHSDRNQIGIRKIPNFLLQIDACLKLGNLFTVAQLDRIY